jgi:hypothetical protein
LQRRQGPLIIGDRVPDDESGLHSLEHVAAPSDSVEEDPAMAGIMCAIVMAVGVDWPERTRGDEACIPAGVDEVAEEPQQQRRPVALAVSATEATASKEAGPTLADESDIEEMLVVIRRDAEEDLFDDLVRQLRRRAVSPE